MKVKVERIHALAGSGAMKAFCDIVIEDSFMVKGLRIMEGKEGLFVAMPSEKSKGGKWFETFYPTSQTVRKDLTQTVLEQYENKG